MASIAPRITSIGAPILPIADMISYRDGWRYFDFTWMCGCAAADHEMPTSTALGTPSNLRSSARACLACGLIRFVRTAPRLLKRRGVLAIVISLSLQGLRISLERKTSLRSFLADAQALASSVVSDWPDVSRLTGGYLVSGVSGRSGAPENAGESTGARRLTALGEIPMVAGSAAAISPSA